MSEGKAKIEITWDELKSRKVDNRLKEQQAMARNRAYAAVDASSLGARTTNRASGLLYNALFYMTVFGLAGGLLAAGLAALLQFHSSAPEEASTLMREMHDLVAARDTGQFSDQQVREAIRQLEAEGRDNAYFAIRVDDSLTDAQKEGRIAQLSARDRTKEFISNILCFGVCGMILAVSLSVAEPLVQRNFAGGVVNGSVGAMLGLLGGAVAALFVDRLHHAAGGLAGSATGIGREIVAQAVTWSVLGIFLSAGAGVVLRNKKKLLIGIAGGWTGGLIGGALYAPISAAVSSPSAGRLIALCAIGAVAGFATGWIENVAKNGWLRVIAGVLAGKEFILYRNPTFIGSSPDSQIYLFKDPAIGSRHAAIYIVPGGFEIDDLPMGSRSTINGKTFSKRRLHHGDQLQCGGTQFLFQEKAHEKR